MRKVLLGAAALAGAALLALPGAAHAAVGPIPAGWTCTGSCGTDGADGNIPLSPLGNSSYEYVSTNGGIGGMGQNPFTAPTSPTNGSLLQTNSFTATAGTTLSFYFDFITSDGGQYADNAWAGVFAAGGSPIAQLYNDTAAVTAYTVGLSTVSWLGSSSGGCYAGGCGTTGWQLVNYTIPTDGTYYMAFGATNAFDTAYDTGLAIDGVALNGQQIVPPTDTPEPASMALFGAGLLGLGVLRRHTR